MPSKFVREEIPIWVPYDGQNIPKDAAKGGREGNQTLFIGRAYHCGSLTPGKVSEIEKNCVIPWGTISNKKDLDFEILVGFVDHNWVAAQDGEVPTNAFPGGNSESGETLYIGRVLHNGCMIVGKIQPSHGVCYIAVNDKEENFRSYEVLVL